MRRGLQRPKIYLAGPTVFYPDALEHFARMKEICSELGLEGVAPIDGQVSLEGIAPGRPLYQKIVEADLGLMDACDGALICMDPFHGKVEMDAGTAFEAGYLFKSKKPLCGWTRDGRDYRDKILADARGSAIAAPNAQGATSGTERDGDGMLVHSAGLTQHGMVQIPIEMRGGKVAADADWEMAFRQAALQLKHLLTRQTDRARA